MKAYALQLKASLDRQTTLYALLALLGALTVGFVVARWGVAGAALLVLVPIAGVIVVWSLTEPKVGMYLFLQLSFLVNGLGRFIPVYAPFGMLADASLALTLLGILLNSERMQWGRLHTPVFYLVLFWFFVSVLEFFNPESVYPMAWVFAVRVVSIYWIQVTVIAILLIRSKRDVAILINIWLAWSVLAAFWAFRQRYIGLIPGEQRWLDAGGGLTHLLFGRLRCFSFYSDAGQFGAEMAYTTLLCLIRVLEDRSPTRKLWYLGIGLILFWGYAVSGTRGALFVILAGFPIYLLLRRNVVIVLAGIVVGGMMFGLLKYTTVGNDIYEINRMRTALDPQDESLQVRIENQGKLADYLSSRPFGAGIGSSGDWAKLYAPGSFLARTPPDSWYVKIWTETGVVGLTLHLVSLLILFFIGVYKVMQLKDRELQSMLLPMLCGYMGVLVASYGNPIFGQFPTNSIMYISLVLFCTCNRLDTDPQVAKRRLQPEAG